jgi:Fe(3+) dicitrate transport protein
MKKILQKSLILLQLPIWAQAPVVDLQPMEILGSREAVRLQTGSSVYLAQEDLQLQNDWNIQRTLNRIPGVFVREEDGFGHFPNISLRGADGTRSEKITVMEDGILAAPAPYSAPAAYYSPFGARMAGIEILKGSSQVRFGPNTTGGVLNYLSTPIPNHRSGNIRMLIEEYHTQGMHLHHGDIVESSSGRWGVLIEAYSQQSEGFRNIDQVEEDTGFRRFEPLFKISWQPGSTVPQKVEFKLGWTDFEANESYLGLSEEDISRHPLRRYAATRYDRIDTEHHRAYLKYTAQPGSQLSLESALYYNRFKRNWYKLDHVSDEIQPGIDSRGRIQDRTSLHTALLQPDILSVLQGNQTGSIGVKANRRLYESYGWQNRLVTSFDTGEWSHDLAIGLRLHHDDIDRFQEVDVYSGTGQGAYTLFREGVPGEEADRRQETTATALYLEDEMQTGPLSLKPGLRTEFLEQRVDDRGEIVSGDLQTWAAGIGLRLELDPRYQLFGGIYRGIAIPGPNARLQEGIREEESLSTELGLRYQDGRRQTEVAVFRTDFSNLVGTDDGFALDGGSNLNAGEALVQGVEWSGALDLASAPSGFALPVYASFTYTDATLKQALTSGGSDNIYAGGQPGARLPYMPEWKVAWGVGFEQGPLLIRLDGTWTDHSYGTAQNLDAPRTSAREGRIDALWIVDTTARWQVSPDLSLFTGVRNLLDESGVSSRLPEGPRSIAPRTVYLGLELAWGAP